MPRGKLLVEGMIPPPLSRDLTVVGKSINRKDGVEKVTGRATYSGDIKLPGMLYAKLLCCPYPRARIVKIDTSKAEALPGVKAVLTKENTKGWRTYWYDIPQLAFPEVITYEGQEVAAVAAESMGVAQKALELIDVEYEILPSVLDAEEALKNPPMRVAGEEYPGEEEFDRVEFVTKRGDINKGFDEADVILEDTYTTQTQYHGTIQTRACVAYWDGKKLTVWDASQGVWNSKLALAKSLGLDPNDVRVIVEYLGGGFGAKAWCQRIAFYAAKLSMVTGKPVRLERTRAEEFLHHPHRWNCKIYLKMGAKKDGRLTAIYSRAIVNLGAAVGGFYGAVAGGNYKPDEINWHIANLYECPNVHLIQIGVMTNLQMTGFQRGPLGMAAIFALESHMDRLAEEFGIGPLEIRLKNYTIYGDQDRKIPYSSKKLDECIKLVTKAIGWERRKRLKNIKQGPKKRGIGSACYLAHQGVGAPPYAANADVVIKNDGTIHLKIGVAEIGGGQITAFSMIAAEELGVSADDIMVIWGDTEGTRYAPSCHVSRCTAEMGPAVLQAAAEARQKLFEIIAPVLGANPDDLESKNGKIYVKSDPSRFISFKDACSKIETDKPIIGRGSRAPNPDAPKFATFGAQAVEVEVDVETGEVKILKIASAHEFGRAINPKFCISQIYGGILFGIGYALSEEGIFDPKTGKMLNTNLHQYREPTSLDFDFEVIPFIVEGEDPYFAYSAKGAAETTNNPTPAAIRNAIYDAVGVWLNDLPITPDKLLNAIKIKNKEK